MPDINGVALFDALAARGVERADITLHVGYGTFKPVKVEDVEEHVVDAERYAVSPETAAALTRARLRKRSRSWKTDCRAAWLIREASKRAR